MGEKADVVACVALRDCEMSEGSERLERLEGSERLERLEGSEGLECSEWSEEENFFSLFSSLRGGDEFNAWMPLH